MSKFLCLLAAVAAFNLQAFEIERHTNVVHRGGVTFVQKGGLADEDYVVRDIEPGAFDVKVTSVNGETGAVEVTVQKLGAVPNTRTINGKGLGANISLDAGDVGALPDSEDDLVTNANFKAAVERVSPPVVLPEKWALGNVTNASGGAVSAPDVGAIAAGENPNGSFSLDPPGSFIGGTSITFSNSEISHSSHITPDVEDATPEYWNWITFGGLGIGDWVDFWSYNNAPVKSVNDKTGSITLNYSDVGAWDSRHEVAAALALGYYGRSFIGGTAPYSLTWDSTRKRFLSKWAVGEIPTSDWVAYLSDLDDYVPTSRKVNDKPLTGNITLSASDVGAVAQGTLHTVATSGSYDDLNNKPTIPPAVTDEHILGIAEENRTSHPYLESRDGGIYVVIP